MNEQDRALEQAEAEVYCATHKGYRDECGCPIPDETIITVLDVATADWQFDPITERWGVKLGAGRFYWAPLGKPAIAPLTVALQIAAADKITGTVYGAPADGYRQVFYFVAGVCTDRFVTKAGKQL